MHGCVRACVILPLRAQAVWVGAALVFLVLTLINIDEERVQTGMNIHFASRLQTGGVTEIPIGGTGITSRTGTLGEQEPFGWEGSSVSDPLAVLGSRVRLVLL